MEYGFIVKDKDSKLFFIHYIDDKKIIMIPSDEPTKKIELLPEYKKNYVIVYKPALRGVCGLKRLHLNRMVNIQYKDRVRQGKIIKKKDDTIHVTFKEDNEPTEVFHFNYQGLPDYMEDIQSIDTKKEYIFNGEEKEIIVEEETKEESYYYSMEQQVQELLEDLTKDIQEHTQLKEINILVNRYIEIHQKYYNEDYNYRFKPLSQNPILRALRNGLFPYISDHVSLRYYPESDIIPIRKDLNKMRDIINPDFPPKFESRFGLESNTAPEKEYSKILEINETNLETLHVDFEPDEVLHRSGSSIDVLIHKIDVNEEMKRLLYHDDLYSIRTGEEVPLDGIIMPSKSRLNTLLSSDSLLSQAKPLDYSQENYVLGTELFTDDNQIWTRNKPFYSFLSDISPTIETLLPYIESKLYNVYDYIKKLYLFQVYELKATQYKAIQKIVQANLKIYKSIQRVALKEGKKYTTTSFLMDSMLTSYPEYYSPSELFRMSLGDNHIMVLYDLYRNLKESNVNALMGELNVDAPPKEDVYDKVYETIQAKDADSLPFFKDLNTGPAIRLLWKTLDTGTFKNEKAFEREMKRYLNLQNKTQHPFYKDDSIITEWYASNSIVTGMMCLVKENNTPFMFQNNVWVPSIERELINGSVSVNRSLNQQINRITRTEGLRKTHFGTREESKRRSTYTRQVNDSFFKKYNDIKRMYSEMYVSYEVIHSPHQILFDTIVGRDNLEDKMKLIRQFCEIYTVEGLDPHWLYCIDSGSKLVPLFMKTLAYSNHYEETLQQICYDQGEQQDEYWVDKHSGYTIKKINFNDEEGFTSEGFKIKSRAVIGDNVLVTLTDTDKDIQTILNAMGIHYEPLKHISDEYNKVKKEFHKTDAIILYAIVFIFIQAYINTDHVKTSFYSCKTSFSGFPATDDGDTSGIDYILCVHKALTQAKKLYKTESFKALIDICLTHSPSLKLKLSTAKPKAKPAETVVQSWDLFLPRLTTITSKKIKNDYYKLFEWQRNIHNYVNTFEPNVKLINGQYKPVNHYSSIQQGHYILPENLIQPPFLRVRTYLQYYRGLTKNDDKFKSKLVYSTEKKKRILKDAYTDSDELDALVRKTLLQKRVLFEKEDVVEKPEHVWSITQETIAQYKREVAHYSIQINKSVLYKLLDKMKGRDKYSNSIFKNLWNDLVMISNRKKNITTYREPVLRKKLESLLNGKHAQVLKKTIERTYEDVFIPNLFSIPPDIDLYSLEHQTILYKYALCEAYKQSDRIMKSKIDKVMTRILEHLNISIKKIEGNNEKERRKEKKDMTDMFKSLSDEDRKAEFLMKQHKLGQWNVGKEVYIYKADAYEEPDMDKQEEITEYEEYIGEDND